MSARSVVLACVIGVVAALGVLEINDSPLLPGTHWDGVEYVTAAESLVDSGTLETPITHWSTEGETSPLSHFPPGFPLVLAGFLLIGAPPHAAVTWALAVGAGATLAMAFLIGARASGTAAGVTSAALLALTPAYVRLHTAVWSEPVFLAVLLGTLFCMWRWPGRSWLHGTLAALAVALRYAGVSLTVVAVAHAWRRGPGPRERTGRAFAAALPSVALLAWWGIVVRAEGQTVRRIGPYDELGTTLGQLPAALVDWLVPWGPGQTGLPLLLAFSLLVGGALVAAAGLRRVGSGTGGDVEGHTAPYVYVEPERDAQRHAERHARRDTERDAQPSPRSLVRLTLGFMAAYVAVVLASRIVLDPEIPFDTRLGMPLIVCATTLFGIGLVSFVRGASIRTRLVVALVTTAWVVGSVSSIGAGVRAAQQSGRFFTSRVWLESPILEWVATDSHDYARIYSIEPGLMYFAGGRPAHALPRKHESLDEFHRVFRARPGAIVFTVPLRRTDLPPHTVLDGLAVRPLIDAREGAIFVPR